MSDETQEDAEQTAETDEEVRAVESMKFDDLNNFLIDKNAERACEACGYSGDWLVHTDKDDKPSIHFMMNYRNADNGALFFSTYCPNCTNTRMFNAVEIVRHLNVTGGIHG